MAGVSSLLRAAEAIEEEYAAIAHLKFIATVKRRIRKVTENHFINALTIWEDYRGIGVSKAKSP